MDFGQALQLIKQRRRVSREGWNGKGQWVALMAPGGEHMTLPYIFIRTVQANCVPWLPSQADILANDWIEVVS